MHRFQIEREANGRIERVPDRAYADLSLRMRRQSDPREVFAELVASGRVRLHEDRAGMLAAVALDAGLEHVAGRGHALSVATNEDAELVNQAVHDWLAEHGHINPNRSVTGSDGLPICAGERVMTRKNDTDLEVANRQTWTVDEIRADRGLVLVNDNGEVREVDAQYARDRVHLAYASTIHGVQGVTARSGACVLTEGTDAAGLYVGMTRGRIHNTLHIEADTLDAAAEQWVTAAQRDRADLGLETARRDVIEEAARYKQPVEVTEPDLDENVLPGRIYADLGDDELQARLTDVIRHRDRAERRLRASATADSENIGPRVQQVDAEARQWSETIHRLNRAEQAAAASREADDRATRVRLQEAEHHATTPKRRDRDVWTAKAQQLRAESEEAVRAAAEATGNATHAARGLPEPVQWPQLRAEAEEGLAGVGARREEAAQLDQREQHDDRAATARLRGDLAQLEAERAALRDEVARRAGENPGAIEQPAAVYEIQQPVEIDRAHERG